MMDKVLEVQQRLRGGVTPAMATPLTSDGYRVNGEVVGQLVEFLVSAGVKGLFVGGTTGEGIVLPAGERLYLHERAVQAAAGRVVIMAHVGANDTLSAVTLAEHAASVGVDALVSVTPYFYGMHDNALLDYFRTVAAAAPQTPFFAYDIPHMATNGISPALLRRLRAEVPTLAGIKTSHGDAQHIRRLIDAAQGDEGPPAVLLLAGNESIALGSLALGAGGLISGLSTAVPEPFVALMEAFTAGNLPQAQTIQRRINVLLGMLPAGARIGAIKQILLERGVDVGPPVPPRPAGSPGLWEQMKMSG
jgi:dihydrodipicolinate synthase/N-acetylneuraminate lyase